MKFEIYDEDKKEKCIRFKLDIDDGALKLIVVNEQGEKIFAILWIDSENGKLYLNNKLYSNMGFSLDHEGRINVIY